MDTLEKFKTVNSISFNKKFNKLFIMKYINKWLLTVFLVTGCLNSGFGQVKHYTLRRNLSTSVAAGFWDVPKYGVKLNSELGVTNGDFNQLIIEVVTVNKLSFFYHEDCNPLTMRYHNDVLLMFATQLNQSTIANEEGYNNDWFREKPRYFWKTFFTNKCSSEADLPYQRIYFKSMAMTANWILPVFRGQPIDRILEVDVHISITGNQDLSIIREIAIPGIEDPITLQDFIKKTEYTANHLCSGFGGSICNTYNDIRSIPDLNAIDMKIQAHRGIWGKDYQENTVNAMDAAVAQGYPLLETDIMPYGVENLTDPSESNFGKPTGLAAYHDFILERYSDGMGFILEKNYADLARLKLKKPRSDDYGIEKMLFFNSNSGGEFLPEVSAGLLGFAAFRKQIGLLIDMKTIENFGSGNSCTLFCEWQSQENKNRSLFHNISLAISQAKEKGNIGALQFLTFKTYLKYDDLKTGLMNAGVSEIDFNKVLWAPMLADSKNDMDPDIIKAFLDSWFLHNESVLYYETNFFTDAAPMLKNEYCIEGQGCFNVMEYIYRMSGRRAGIFAEEPVGGKGTVNRWGKWSIKNPVNDRRGDHLWLLSKPFFKHAVITTDRPDIWKQLND